MHFGSDLGCTALLVKGYYCPVCHGCCPHYAPAVCADIEPLMKSGDTGAHVGEKSFGPDLQLFVRVVPCSGLLQHIRGNGDRVMDWQSGDLDSRCFATNQLCDLR